MMQQIPDAPWIQNPERYREEYYCGEIYEEESMEEEMLMTVQHPAESGAELMTVKQLPIIEEHLREKAEEVKTRTELACSMACTPDTVVQVKKIRAELNKEFAAFEDGRKQIKKAIMAPYEEFEATYEECIRTAYKQADTKLKGMIENTEFHLRQAKEQKIRQYYAEHAAAAGLNTSEWPFEKAGISVTLSKSDKSLKAEAKAFVERVAADLSAINAMEHGDEIAAEYKKAADLGQALNTVQARHKAIEEIREEWKAREAAKAERAKAVEEMPAVQALECPTVETVEEAPQESPQELIQEEPILRLTFTVRSTRNKLKALKQFLEEGGYEIVK